MYYKDKDFESIDDYINEYNYDYDDSNMGMSFYDFEFTSIPNELQERAEELYISEQSMSDMYDSFIVYEKLCKLNNNQIPMLNGDWAFEKSGTYKGIITECERSKKSQFDYIIKVLINAKEVKYIKFTHSNLNIIYRSIRNLACKDDDYFNTDNLIGKIVVLDVKNKKFHGNRVFSNITRFEIMSDKDEAIIIEMIKTMLKYYDESESNDY